MRGDVVIDPVAWKQCPLVALNKNRRCYGFEIKKDFYAMAKSWIESNGKKQTEIADIGYAKTELEKSYPTIF